MKKVLMGILFFFVVSMISCSGYFDQEGLQGDNLADTLAIANGGGYISGPSNDISPFLFRDTNGNNPILFFSSDREGDYDIYYARMNEQGNFQVPQVLADININTTNQELYPQVYHALGSSFTTNKIFLSFVRVEGGQSVIYTYQADTSFTNFILRQSFTNSLLVTALFIEPDVNNFPYPDIYILDGFWSGDVRRHGWSPAIESWNTTWTNVFSNPLGKIDSMHYYHDGNNAYSGDVTLFEYLMDGHKQLYLSIDYRRLNPPLVLNQIFPVREYASSYNDRWPFVDYPDDAKVYFASDRGENGDYDLYRHNYYSLSNVLPTNPYVTTNNTEEG